MRRTSLSLAGGLTAALLLVSAPAAQAAVGPKDAPSKGDIVKVFPELADGEFATEKTKQIAIPDSTCGASTTKKAKSAVSTTGVSAAGQPVVQVGVVEVKSSGQAKTYLAAYKKYVKKCATFTEPTTGATVTTQLTKAPKVGQASLAIVQQTSIMGITSHSSSVLVRDGKRLASIVAIDDAPISTSSMKKLAKVAAKKMK
jgi:hypothetical protein